MKRTFQKKLSLNKKKLADLNIQELGEIKVEGGASQWCSREQCATRICTRCVDECNCTGWGGVATGCKYSRPDGCN